MIKFYEGKKNLIEHFFETVGNLRLDCHCHTKCRNRYIVGEHHHDGKEKFSVHLIHFSASLHYI